MSESSNSTTVESKDGWPPLPMIEQNDPLSEVKQILYQGRVNAVVAKAAADVEREKAHYASYYANVQTVYNSYIDVAKSGIDRSRTGAEFIEKASSAVGVLYAALIGLIFTVAGDKSAGNSLPLRGVVPVLYLGAAIVLAAVYRSIIVKEEGVRGPQPKGNPLEDQQEQLLAYLRWCKATVIRRRAFLNASVVSLAIGIVFLPAPFLDISDTASMVWAIIGLVPLFLVIALTED